jgi:hypothetical protein
VFAIMLLSSQLNQRFWKSRFISLPPFRKPFEHTRDRDIQYFTCALTAVHSGTPGMTIFNIIPIHAEYRFIECLILITAQQLKDEACEFDCVMSKGDESFALEPALLATFKSVVKSQRPSIRAVDSIRLVTHSFSQLERYPSIDIQPFDDANI